MRYLTASGNTLIGMLNLLVVIVVIVVRVRLLYRVRLKLLTHESHYSISIIIPNNTIALAESLRA